MEKENYLLAMVELYKSNNEVLRSVMKLVDADIKKSEINSKNTRYVLITIIICFSMLFASSLYKTYKSFDYEGYAPNTNITNSNNNTK